MTRQARLLSAVVHHSRALGGGETHRELLLLKRGRRPLNCFISSLYPTGDMMPLRCRGPFAQALLSSSSPARLVPSISRISPSCYSPRRRFHPSPAPCAIRSQILKDVGEGITEIQIIQWYVQEGAKIEEWKPLCQYQSDKAVDDITSRYDGVIKKLHFQADDTVPTGMALCDIDVDESKYPDENAPHPPPANEPITPTPEQVVAEAPRVSAAAGAPPEPAVQATPPPSKYASLATPAVRGMLKELKVDILKVNGTGKDGRVMKEDVLRYVAERDAAPSASQPTQPSLDISTPQTETTTPLTSIQFQMFKTMTRSLNIPHFLYADELDIRSLSSIRKKLASQRTEPLKLSYLPFIIKAVSLSLNSYPLLNARVDTTTNPNKPALVMRSSHNIGVAMDTPTGLLVPNIKNVQARSILDIAAELTRLRKVARAGKLTLADLNGGTITVSNIGNIGGTYVGPVIVPNEVAILGIGRAKTVPVFDEDGNVVKGEKVNFSWSADHRVVDGATMARMAEKVRLYLEEPESMILALR
ncbi:2-oxoisovalerate dehydrogenase E2 component (dihydrolipoyl transacylase) [Blastomyces dermatitidis ATCC 18188]|uniref:Dihydrolipoamide acetyltransferase component of pyruvate dehydrogenase complex n=1 Tax=Ajellomyces dermatitidis (strain ATCC 18188 / CBS 674.68) TaxID=653446 RepID=F2TL03_AJEDA|nr:2-oxoisovalerate dehydrogenase E2 component (dihydrolipoyl transacylase) [Blastomyces dermatitidis ATCC 18188]